MFEKEYNSYEQEQNLKIQNKGTQNKLYDSE